MFWWGKEFEEFASSRGSRGRKRLGKEEGEETKVYKEEFTRLELLRCILMLGKADTSRKELEDGLKMAKRDELVGKKISGRMSHSFSFAFLSFGAVDANLVGGSPSFLINCRIRMTTKRVSIFYEFSNIDQ